MQTNPSDNPTDVEEVKKITKMRHRALLIAVLSFVAGGVLSYFFLNKKLTIFPPAVKPEMVVPNGKVAQPDQHEKPHPPSPGVVIFQPTKHAALAIVETGVSGMAWTLDHRLSFAGRESYTAYGNAHPIIIGLDGIAHLTWYATDSNDKNFYSIYYQKSFDGGESWMSGISLTAVANFMGGASNAAPNPALAVSGENIFLVWSAQPERTVFSKNKKTKPVINNQIYLKQSANNGVTWQKTEQLTNLDGRSFGQSLWAEGEHLYLVWTRMLEDVNGESNEVFFKHSGDLGKNWDPEIRLSKDGIQPTVVSSGERVLIFWMSLRDDNWEIYYKHSSDRGIVWSEEIRFTNNAGISEVPAVAMDGQTVHLVWEDSSNGPTDFDYEIYYRRSEDGGVSWADAERLTNAPKYSLDPSISARDGDVHVVFADRRDGREIGRIEDKEVYYVYSIDGGRSWSENIRLTNSPANSILTSVWFQGDNAHIVWTDWRDGIPAVFYKRGTVER